MMKNLIFFQRLFLLAQMKRPDALNATQKTPALYNVPFLKKSRKTAKNAHCFKNAIFWRFLQIYSGTVHCRDLGSFALYSVHQDASFELSKSIFRQFFIFFTLRGDPFDWGGVKILPTPEVEGLERKERQFQKWHDICYKMGGCKSCYSGKSPIIIPLLAWGPCLVFTIATHWS